MTADPLPRYGICYIRFLLTYKISISYRYRDILAISYGIPKTNIVASLEKTSPGLWPSKGSTSIVIFDYDVASNSLFTLQCLISDFKFCDWRVKTLSLRWSITLQTPLLWVPEENFSWYSVRNTFHKVTSAVKFWLYNDSLYQNLLIFNQDYWSYLKM